MKIQCHYKQWENAGERIDETEAREHFKDPIKVSVSVGYRSLDGRWVEVQSDHAWTRTSAPGATIIPAKA